MTTDSNTEREPAPLAILSGATSLPRRRMTGWLAKTCTAVFGGMVTLAVFGRQDAEAAHCFCEFRRAECRRDNSCPQSLRRRWRVYEQICCPPAGSCYFTGRSCEDRGGCC